MVGNRGIFGDSDSVSLLLDRVEQAKSVAGTLEVIEVGPVSYLASKFLVAAPLDGEEHFSQAVGLASLLGHCILAFSLSPVLGTVRVIGHIFVTWIGQTSEYLWLTIPYGLTRVMGALESHVS